MSVRIRKKVMGIALTAAMILTAVPTQSFAYIERGDVQIGGSDSYTLTVGETAELTISPYEEDHMQGCGMADCPDVCGEKDCITYVNGQPECVCAGTEMITFYADVAADSSDDSVASVEYDDSGKVVITAVGEGTADIDIEASFREYNTAEKTVSVTVKAAQSGNENGSGSGDQGSNGDSSNDQNSGSGNGGQGGSSSGGGDTPADNSSTKPSTGGGSGGGGGGGGSSASSSSTIVEPQTPAASVPASADVAEAVSFSVRTYNTNRTEDGQTVEVAIRFDKPIKVGSGAEKDVLVKIAGSALNESPNTENGASNRTLSVKGSDADDCTLIITIGCVSGAKFVKQTNASISVQAAASGVSHILTAETGKPADLKFISTVIPSGIVLSDAGSSGNSVTKQVTHRSNVRSMVYIQLLRNGKPLITGADHEGSYVIHAHCFIETPSNGEMLPEMTEADYARAIADGFTAFAASNQEIADRYTVKAEGDKVIFTDMMPEGTETLDLRLFEYPVAGASVKDAPSGEPASGVNCSCGMDGCSCAGGECICGNVCMFTDVPDWAKDYVNYLVGRGILNGRSTDTFAPNDNVTRAEFVKILALASGETIAPVSSTSFSDVPATAWYAPYVEWAYRKGIVTGNSDRNFKPQDNITRQDIAVMIQRYSTVTGRAVPVMVSASAFSDSASISTYARDAVSALQKGSVVSGDVNGNFYPKSCANRAQAAKMVAVYLQVTGE